jgi:glycosyltransferase involved in cell wall biosynthesis
MHQSPTFSVVIPTYNRADMIVKTLESVFRQIYPAYEIIVVDNCSTDNTEQVLQPYIDSGKIRFIKHDRNYERARSRNTAMDNSSGVFVTFLDSDDLMYPTNLLDAAQYARENPGIKLFHNLYQLVDSDGKVLYKYRFPRLDDPNRAIAEGNFISCIGVFIHCDIYQQYRFDTNSVLSGSEDWEFWLRVMADHRPGRINKVNSGVVHHGNRTVAEADLKKIWKRLSYIITKFSNDPHLSAVYKDHLNRLEVSSLIYVASAANSGQQYKEALRFLRRACFKDFRAASSLKFLRVLQIAILRMNKGV